MNEEIAKFRDGIFALNTRRFGRLAELMIQKMYDMKDSNNLAFDLLSKYNEKIEVKFSTVLKKCSKQITAKNVIEQAINSRLEKRPVDMPSAGSTFKRGTNFISAQLIDEAGLKGYSIGGAQVSKKHAGFIINTGNATAQDILDLIDYVIKVVYKKFGKVLELEVEVIGE